MDRAKRERVLEILDYWTMTEFLGQTDIAEESAGNRKLIQNLEKGEKVSAAKIEVFTDIVVPYIQVDAQVEADAKRFPDFPSYGGEFCFCIGRIERNTFVDYLSKYMTGREEMPELAYPKKSAIAWFSFKTDAEGIYLADSFQLSPLLWAASVWEKSRIEKDHDFYLDKADYDKITNTFNDKLQEQNVTQFLADLFTEIQREYVVKQFPNLAMDKMGFSVYNRYISEEERDKDEEPAEFADLGKSFFLNDIMLLSQAVRTGTFGEGSEFEQKVIDYILSAYEKSKGMGDMRRTFISPKEPKETMRGFFEKVLDVYRAPLGKWPAKFMPALMQQVAVNLAIDEKGHTPIFSVNGPPGTGKTTLLKEIVASNIVERARLLAEFGDDPDLAFEKRFFTQGPLEDKGHAYYSFAPNYYALKNDKVNDYGMLVASCNNAAVENITVDLPKANDILESLESSEDDPEAVKAGLDEVHALFDIEQSEDVETITLYGKSRQEKDIYFTRYANSLLGTKDCWGLVSAPFGRRANVKKYCTAVLKPFVEEYKRNETRELHRERYARQRALFLHQLEVVEELREELERLCKAGSAKADAAPIDSVFMERYVSPDEKEATRAQVTNPWFTAQYNREREKLFLYACRLHKEFVAASKAMRHNMINLLIAWNMCDDCSEKMKPADREAAMPVLLQSVFLMTPVISTTFASVQTFLSDIKTSGVLGTLIVDEAGQAQPQMPVGALFRCRKAVIVGDPKQIEPVVTAETDMIKQLYSSKLLASYKDKKSSVQGFADYINPYGTFLGADEEREWVGCPLVVHRRCIDPMYTISNVLSYDGTMKQQTGAPKASRCATFILDRSCWINVAGSENSGVKDHFVRAQGEVVLRLLEEKFRKNPGTLPKLFIITPFTSVKNGIIDMIRKSQFYKKEPRVKKWLEDNNIGTVHTF